MLNRVKHPGTHALAGILLILGLFIAPTVQAQDESDNAKVKGRIQKLINGQQPKSIEDVVALEEQVTKLVPDLMKATVGIRVGPAQGSGVIVGTEGYVLTAAHVAGRPNRRAFIILEDGTAITGETLGLNNTIDAGVIKITQEDWNPNNWPHAEIGTSESVKLGQWCIAVGHPGGFQPDRNPVVRFGRVIHKYHDVVTTDCTLIGGDSGGPLFDLTGKVIGIHSRIGPELTHNVHVPISAYKNESWDRMLAGERWGDAPRAPFIGVRGSSEEKNCLIAEVIEGSPASLAGIKPNDVIVKFANEKISNFDSLILAVGIRRPGEVVDVVVQRGEEEVSLQLTIAQAGGVNPEEEPKDSEGQEQEENSNDDKDKPDKSDDSRNRLPLQPQLVGEQSGIASEKAVDLSLQSVSWIRSIMMLKPAGLYERNHVTIRQAFDKVIEKSGECTVRITSGKQSLALGTIVSEKGYIITKASQLKGDKVRGDIECVFADGSKRPIEIAAINEQHDIALLKVNGKRKLVAVQIADDVEVPVIGSWVITPGLSSTPLTIGVVSTKPRAIKGGLLGVLLGESEESVFVERVFPGSAADRAKMNRGDVILSVNDKDVENRQMLIDLVRSHLPGETLKFKIKRGEDDIEIDATLGRESDVFGSEALPRGDIGGPLSERRSGFPAVFQHDSVVQPNECGGPLLDINGKMIGMNIARAGRVSSYGLSAKIVAEVITALMAEADGDESADKEE
ncbi:MAG: trypsin-like peptidase domain-containing protein [Pirellulales bacterium]|nr:trypsin-like peptidase domain-containing protein [Pirellulales bacterium]